MKNKASDLEKRLTRLEKAVFKDSRPATRTTKKSQLVSDLDSLMKDHHCDGGIIFSGVAIPSKSEERFIRWSSSGNFKTVKELNKFIDDTSTDTVFDFCQSFSSKEKLSIIKALIKNESLTQKEIVKLTEITQGKFYHHIKDLISNKFVINEDGQYLSLIHI